jgi:hypothetical protein
MSNKRLTRLIFFVTATLCLQACQPKQSLPTALENYSDRIYKVLLLENKDININSTLNFPLKTSLIVEIPDLNIKMRAFYAIENCAIKQLIAERNTALGKTQLPSVRLKYEWDLINELKNCSQQDINIKNKPLLDKMDTWLSQKEAAFPLNWANMITQSDEFYLSLSASAGFIEGNEEDNFTQSLFDLKNLISIKQNPQQQLLTMESSLQSVNNHRLYARLWRSQQLLAAYLNIMTDDISQWSNTFTCKTRKEKEKLAIIRNVFTLFFIQEIQPIASQINHYHYILKPELVNISEDPELPQAFRVVISNYTNNEFTEYQESMLKHVKLWQEIFKKCD